MRKRKAGVALFLLCALFLGLVHVPMTKAASAGIVAGDIYTGGSVLREEDLEEKLKKQLEEAQAKKNAIESKKNELAERSKNLKSEYDDIEKYIQEMDQKQSDMLLEIAELEAALDELKAELEITNQQLAEAEKKEQVQYEALKRRFQYLYEHGNLTDLEVLLGSRDLSDILNYEQYASSIRVYDYLLARRYSEAKHDVELVKERLESQISVLESSHELYEQDFAYVQEVIANKEAALADYEEMIGATEEDLEEYLSQFNDAKADVDKLKGDIAKEQARKAAEAAKKAAEELKKRQQQEAQQSKEEREKKYGNVPHTGASSASAITKKNEKDPSKMIWPLPGDSRTGSGFGPRRAPIKGASTFHKGVDIGGKFGSEIVASLAGTVKIATYSSSAGNYIEVDHGNGYVTRYLHCSKLLVKKGDTVLQGQVIGLVGSTGVSTAPHLHFSVVIDGVSVDPLLYVRY